MKLSEIAGHINAKLIGNGNYEISGIENIEKAKAGELTFLSNPVYEKFFSTTNAGAVIISEKFYSSQKDGNKTNLLITEDPYLSFLTVLELLNPVNIEIEHGIHRTAITESELSSDGNIAIGANVYIGKNCSIGSDTRIFHNTVIMNNVKIGENVLIYPNVTIYSDTVIGSNVIIHSGTVVGSDGFGQAKTSTGAYKKIPQTGNVVIEDEVEIGSNCSIDRATFGETKICRGVKLDNMIQVAHNVYIGENTVIAAQTGIAGSTKIGKNCMIGGQVGIVGHIEICDNVIITASVGVSKSITQPGMYSGYRAQPIRKELKKEALIRNLENIINDLKKNKC